MNNKEAARELIQKAMEAKTWGVMNILLDSAKRLDSRQDYQHIRFMWLRKWMETTYDNDRKNLPVRGL